MKTKKTLVKELLDDLHINQGETRIDKRVYEAGKEKSKRLAAQIRLINSIPPEQIKLWQQLNPDLNPKNIKQIYDIPSHTDHTPTS